MSQIQPVFGQEKGIQLKMTVSYTPKHNGHAKNLNWTLGEKARSMLLDSNLNKNIWGKGLCAAAYLINYPPTSTVEAKTTQMWFLRNQMCLN